jgi:hypothetical protein
VTTPAGAPSCRRGAESQLGNGTTLSRNLGGTLSLDIRGRRARRSFAPNDKQPLHLETWSDPLPLGVSLDPVSSEAASLTMTGKECFDPPWRRGLEFAIRNRNSERTNRGNACAEAAISTDEHHAKCSMKKQRLTNVTNSPSIVWSDGVEQWEGTA